MDIHYFESKHPVNWHWPLQVGMLPNDWSTTFLPELTANWWHPKLVRTYILNRGRLHANILLVNGNLKATNRDFRSLRMHCKSDIVIHFCDNADIPMEWGEELESLASAWNCNGIVFIPVGGDFQYVDWCNELLFNLSHDNDFRKSVENFNDKGALFITQKLERETKLSNFARKFVKNLKSLPVEIKDKDPGYHGAHRIRDIAEHLDHELPNYRFDHESGEASVIAEMTTETAHTVTTTVANEGVARREIMRGREALLLRYLQSQILDENGMTMFKLLQAGKPYSLNVRIGPSDLQWLQGNRSEPLNIDFGESDEEQDVLIVFKSNLSEEVQSDTIKIGPKGPSTIADFSFACAEPGREFVADILAYHKNRLIQSAGISAYFVDDPEGNYQLPFVMMETLTSPRMLLNNLGDRMEFAASIHYEADENPDALMVNSSKKVSYKLEAGLEKILKKIKADIEEVVLHTDDYPEDLLDEKNAIIFNRLAQKGRLLYDNYLKDLGDFDGPIQIISGLHDYIPLEFVYTYPAPKQDARICPKAKEALIAGKCADCIDMDKTPAEYICPFGFISFSKVVERHDVNHRNELLESGDFAFHSEPAAGRPSIALLNSTIFGSAKRVESHAAGLIRQVADFIGTSAKIASEADTWENWKKTVKERNPDCLVLIVHTEDNKDLDIPQMEIGDKDFILQTHIGEDIVDPAGKEPAPVVILIGCSTQDNEMPAFDFTSQFKNKGAALVLSTFTKVRGRHAGPIVMKLFEFFKSMKGTELRFGEIMLKLRQYLLSQGMIVSLALIVNGDADWKIKL